MSISKSRALLLALAVLIFMGGSYYVGTQSGAQSSATPKEQQAISTSTYLKNQEAFRKQLNQLTNDYESACFNYQSLYTAYDELYKKTGSNSGLQQLARVDGARGNEDSCYR